MSSTASSAASSTASSTARCPVCEGADVRVFLERDRVPVHQNLRYDSLEAAMAAPAGRLRLGVCTACGFVYNTAFDPGLLSYGAQYENDQGHSGAFQAHLDALVERVLGADGVRGGVVVEVGCGQGQFLRRLVADPTAGVIGHGFDPSYRGEDQPPSQPPRLYFHREMYGPDSARVTADVLLCRHVIEHIPTPAPFLDSVASALAGSGYPRVYFETPDVSWIFEHKVYFDVFYEHCSYFSPGSIRAAFGRAGFDVTAVDRIFGGQYLWLEARRGTDGANRSALEPGELPAMALAFGDAEARWRSSAAAALRDMAGPVAVWGAGAKGATYASLLDPDHQHIDCIVDINPGKQGAFLPGSGHPVLAPEALIGRGVRTVVLMNPNYRDEVAASLAALLPNPPTLIDA